MRRRYLFELQRYIRQFFEKNNFLEVMVPPLVENPGMEVHIHPFQAYSVVQQKQYPYFLQTSPEFKIKELLSTYQEENLKNIFNLSYAFRDEPSSPHHRFQFVMLEWYRIHENYLKIKQDIQNLVSFCWKNFTIKYPELMRDSVSPKWTFITVEELFTNELHFSILDFLEAPELYQKIARDFKDIPLQENSNFYQWDDLFFLLFLNKLEPLFAQWPYLIIDEYPAPLSALSTLKPSDPRVCQRFEAYIHGIELGNCFNELTNLQEQEKRFEMANKQMKALYDYHLPRPHELYRAMDKGLPNSAGIALGVERLLQSLLTIENPFFD